ncbi:Putative methionine and alanine importer, small subunit [Acinetobacter marinus]|uniref:Methionine and alanine importer, small subunit n=1 Tax=Acinetobacter marinus TaxID=281375 RepID=A0A1G6NZI9_9GAMM|nr:methionine/alanine import family NSS transporter small subunit [Acinetobacter marinus]SDC73209.1 Putative methionine and alanine importer, small subunit [Acinetobacter marinus]
MSNSALMMMIVSILALWGGLLWAMIHLVKHPDPED